MATLTRIPRSVYDDVPVCSTGAYSERSLDEVFILRDLFLLNPDVVFLNHGSFGACPRAVFEVYQHWQIELERDPIDFFGRRAEKLILEARQRLGEYLNAQPENLVFVTNATVGHNIVARTLPLEPGDEILSTNQEYGAVNNAWRFICQKTGARLINHPMPLPVTTHDEFVNQFWQGVTPRTRVISISHITSPTALIFPVAEICRRAREAGIITFVDGAHAPGQIPVDLEAIGADYYTGNCHKWLCAPKGAGFLYARPERHATTEPLIVSHGWGPETTFVSSQQWQGTRDLAPFLAVPAAIDFQREHQWENVRRRCHGLASDLRGRVADWFGTEPISPDSPDWFAQMVTIPVPKCDAAEVGRRLWEDYRIEVPFGDWGDQGTARMRVSFQAYNTAEDSNHLFNALKELIPI